MALFATLFVLFFALQWLHWRFLRHLLPERAHRFIPGSLVLIHLPLVVYMGLRFAGFADHGLGPWLRPLARGAFYFQALTLLNLLGGFLTEGLYRMAHRRRLESGLEAPSRRAFLQGAATAGMGAVAVGGGFGWAQAYGDPLVSRHDLYFPDLAPGLDGLRILQLSTPTPAPWPGPEPCAAGAKRPNASGRNCCCSAVMWWIPCPRRWALSPKPSPAFRRRWAATRCSATTTTSPIRDRSGPRWRPPASVALRTPTPWSSAAGRRWRWSASRIRRPWTAVGEGSASARGHAPTWR